MPARALFPVVAAGDGGAPPEGAETWYVLAANGLFLERRTPLYRASVPAHGGVPGLDAHHACLELHVPPLPRALVERAVGFFRTLCARVGGEGILVLFYAPDERRFAAVAPPQLLPGRWVGARFRADLRLAYGAAAPPGPGFLRLGSIHSHGRLGPTHSLTDEDDELGETGLHVTAGYVDSSRPAFAAAFVVGRHRFRLDPASVVPRFVQARTPPAAWLAQVMLGGGPDVRP